MSRPHQATAMLVLMTMLTVSFLRLKFAERWDASNACQAIRGSLFGESSSDSPPDKAAGSVSSSDHPDLGILGIALLVFVGLLKLHLPDVLGFSGTPLLVAKLAFGGLIGGLLLFWTVRSLKSEPPEDPAGLPDDVLMRLYSVRSKLPRTSWAAWFSEPWGRSEPYLYLAIWTIAAVTFAFIWAWL
jgi:hypothetical protein